MYQTKDESLKKQLSERIAYDEKCIALYKEKAAGHVYVLSSIEKRNFDVCGYYADHDAAYKWGLEELPFGLKNIGLSDGRMRRTKALPQCFFLMRRDSCGLFKVWNLIRRIRAYVAGLRKRMCNCPILLKEETLYGSWKGTRMNEIWITVTWG